MNSERIRTIRPKAGTKVNVKQPGKKKASMVAVMPKEKVRVAKAPAAESVQRTTDFKVISAGENGSIKIHGQEFLGYVPVSIASSSSVPAGTVLNNLPINPQSFKDTRLEKYGDLFEKYCFKRLKFHFDSSCPSSMYGALLLAYDKDAEDSTPPNNGDGIRQYFGMAGTRSDNIWKSFSIDCPLTDSQDWYYTSDTGIEDRITEQGQLYAVVADSIAGPVSLDSVGKLWVEYECHFMDPQLERDQGSARLAIGNHTGSGAANAGWNQLALEAKSLGTIIFAQDETGNRGLRLPPGNWFVLQIMLSANANSGFGALGMRAVQPFPKTLPTSSNIFTHGNTNVGQATRLDRVTATSGGVILYGNFPTYGAVGPCTVRVWRDAPDIFV